MSTKLGSYVSLDDTDVRAFASDDSPAFHAHYGRKTIIDEAQRVLGLFSYIQDIVDETGEPGQFVVSESQNSLLMEANDRSPAELDAVGLTPATTGEWLFAGCYPRIYDRGIDPADYYPNYVRTPSSKGMLWRMAPTRGVVSTWTWHGRAGCPREVRVKNMRSQGRPETS